MVKLKEVYVCIRIACNGGGKASTRGNVSHGM